MFIPISAITEIIILISAISVDTFSTAFTYGISDIKIPLKSSFVIHTISSLIIVLAYCIGFFLTEHIPTVFTEMASFIVLLLLGTEKLFESIIKRSLRKSNHHKKDISFSLMNLNFILSVYADPNSADIDYSKRLSAKEAIALAITLSLDNLPIGIGLGLSKVSILCIIISAIITEEIALRTGYGLGKKMSEKLKCDISWIGGILLIILAISKVI